MVKRRMPFILAIFVLKNLDVSVLHTWLDRFILVTVL